MKTARDFSEDTAVAWSCRLRAFFSPAPFLWGETQVFYPSFWTVGLQSTCLLVANLQTDKLPPSGKLVQRFAAMRHGSTCKAWAWDAARFTAQLRYVIYAAFIEKDPLSLQIW